MQNKIVNSLQSRRPSVMFCWMTRHRRRTVYWVAQRQMMLPLKRRSGKLANPRRLSMLTRRTLTTFRRYSTLPHQYRKARRRTQPIRSRSMAMTHVIFLSMTKLPINPFYVSATKIMVNVNHRNHIPQSTFDTFFHWLCSINHTIEFDHRHRHTHRWWFTSSC